MPGLHECPVCHYRFEDKESLDEHTKVCFGDGVVTARGCPSNTVCHGTCEHHSPLRPEHREVSCG